MPRLVYARPAPPLDGRPRVALVLAGFGQMEADSRAAIALPGQVTLAVSAYAANPAPLMAAARAAGHELLASLPMESEQLALNDAGRLAMLTGEPPAANAAVLEQVMGRIQGYAGMTGASDGMLGERFAAQSSSFNAVLEELGRRGLFYIDPRVGSRSQDAALPAGTFGAGADAVIELQASRRDVLRLMPRSSSWSARRGSAAMRWASSSGYGRKQ